MSTRPWQALVVALVLATGACVAWSQAELSASIPMVRIPGAIATVTEGAIVLSVAGRELVYVDGFGWLADLEAPPPDVIDGVVYGAPELLAALALDLPVVEAVRFAGDAQVRMVIDVPALDARALAGIERNGSVAAGETLRFTLPALLVPSGLNDAYAGLEVRLHGGSEATEVEVSGGAFSYEVFALATPTRIVLDLALERPRLGPDTVEALTDGITYRRVRANGASGPTWVHVLDIAPGVGEWRVVGALGEVRTTDRWASGAFAAINGGYFDTGTRQVIGMLVVDGNMLSLPSRGRAVIAFGDGPPLIDRVRATYSVWLDDVPVAVRGAPFVEQISVVKGPGWAGSGRFGVLVIDRETNEVRDNRIGPVRIGADQVALVYPAELRPLAMAESGVHVRYAVHIEPAAFGAARYAVEAGPLLLKDGRNVLQPELEQFAVGQRILDGVTQQAAIGVRADGSVVLVAAEAMVAADLVPLLLELGARDALRLDSGGSTTLYADGRVFNRRSEREVVNAIVLRLP